MFLLPAVGFGATIAIIDSGVDKRHTDLYDKIWVNTSETYDNRIDDDLNGYVDDYYGWNFADNDQYIMDYSLMWLFDENVARFFHIQAKSYDGTLTQDDVSWIQDKFKDQEFINRAMAYGTFMHGTHVSGIVANNNENATIMAIKLL